MNGKTKTIQMPNDRNKCVCKSNVGRSNGEACVCVSLIYRDLAYCERLFSQSLTTIDQHVGWSVKRHIASHSDINWVSMNLHHSHYFFFLKFSFILFCFSFRIHTICRCLLLFISHHCVFDFNIWIIIVIYLMFMNHHQFSSSFFPTLFFLFVSWLNSDDRMKF